MFISRIDAGRQLGRKLKGFSSGKPVVLGITRGGVVVAAEVAKVLKAPLFPLVIKKIGSPFNPEFALGAMAPDGTIVGDVSEVLPEKIQETKNKIQTRLRMYQMSDRKLAKAVKNKTAVVVDDGIATGLTFQAAIKYVQAKSPSKIIAAAPVADREVIGQLEELVDGLVILEVVDGLGAVGRFYEDFSEVSDEEVMTILHQ